MVTVFEDNDLLFWVPDVLFQHSEVVCRIYSALKCSFDEFVGERVVSLSYSSTILGLPLKISIILKYFRSKVRFFNTSLALSQVQLVN